MHATHVDLYQLTSLVPHFVKGRAHDQVVMSFFSRRLPKHVHTGLPARPYLLFAGLERCLDYLEHARLSDDRMRSLSAHPTLGPALDAHPKLAELLANWRFQGHIRAPKEGTPLFAGPAIHDGKRVSIQQVEPSAYVPYLVIETDLLSAKLIETPLLSIINHMTMVASKASLVVAAAKRAGPSRDVLEFGSRRTHPAAAVDAAVAAYLAGCTATSNVEANARYGVPMSGTMDHFAIQAWEEEGVPRFVTEEAYFRAFHKQYPTGDVMLVDTYDTFGEQTGIRSAVRATDGKGPVGIRLDSGVNHANLVRARSLLDQLGATQTKIYVSGGMDEHAIAALSDAPVDGYGIGERIVTSPDAPVGVGAVAKVSVIRGQPSMKLSRASGKATLPGRLQAFERSPGDIIIGTAEEALGTPMLGVVWDENGRRPTPSLHEARRHAADCIAKLPEEMLSNRLVNVPVSTALFQLIDTCVRTGLTA